MDNNKKVLRSADFIKAFCEVHGIPDDIKIESITIDVSPPDLVRVELSIVGDERLLEIPPFKVSIDNG